MQDRPNIAFVGAGHLTSHVMAGLIQSGYPTERLWVSAPRQDILDVMRERFSVHVTTDNATAVEVADIVVLAVRPEHMRAVADSIRDVVSDHVIVSVAIALSVSQLQPLFGERAAIIRAMPNLPSAVGAGVTGLYAGPHVSGDARDAVEMLFQSVGVTAWLSDEKLIDVVTVCMGSGPGYMYDIMAHLRRDACERGLPEDVAELFVLHMVLGSAKLALLSEKSLGELRDAVSVPGGTTASIIEELEKHKVPQLLSDSLEAGFKRITAVHEKHKV